MAKPRCPKVIPPFHRATPLPNSAQIQVVELSPPPPFPSAVTDLTGAAFIQEQPVRSRTRSPGPVPYNEVWNGSLSWGGGDLTSAATWQHLPSRAAGLGDHSCAFIAGEQSCHHLRSRTHILQLESAPGAFGLLPRPESPGVFLPRFLLS